jgi:hypothetical protein
MHQLKHLFVLKEAALTQFVNAQEVIVLNDITDQDFEGRIAGFHAAMTPSPSAG